MNELRCDVCGAKCEVAIVDDFAEDNDDKVIYKYFCEQHYQEYCNNEIELPTERLELLTSLYD